MQKMTVMSKCASVAHHVNSHAEVFEGIHAASPNAAGPGLLRKPLDAAIGRLLTPYHLGGRQGERKQNNDVTCTHFDGRFDGHRDAAVLYRVHRPMEEVRGFHKSH